MEWGNVLPGKCGVGKCLTGEMFDWGNVFQGNLRWGKGGQGYLRWGLMLDNLENVLNIFQY